MGERITGYQRAIPELKEHLPGATHTIYPGAVIRVKMKTSIHYAAGTVQNEFDAALQPEEPHHEPKMLFFLAMGPFSVFYNNGHLIEYPAGTALFAYKPRRDYDQVERIPKSAIAK